MTLWLGGHLLQDGMTLGWTSLAMQALLILGLCWLIGGRITRVMRPLPARWILYLSVGSIVLGISGTLLEAVAIHETGPRFFGAYLAVTTWGTTVLLQGIVIAAGLLNSSAWASGSRVPTI